MTVALVTGAGKRIGRAISLVLAEEGYDIAAHYASSSTEAESLCEEVRSKGCAAQPFQADLTREADMQSLLPRVVEHFDRPVTVLVNNASIFEHDMISNGTRDSWDRHLESNLRAPVVLTQAMAAQVPEPLSDGRGEPLSQGVIINMIDQRARKLTPHFMSYTIAKMGLWAFTRTAAQELGPRIRVNGIGPGPTLRGGRQSEENFAQQRANTVLKRGSNPEDITAAVRYILHAPALTGQLLCIDGGQHLAWETPDVVGVE